jgi:hypothetical protein
MKLGATKRGPRQRRQLTDRAVVKEGVIRQSTNNPLPPKEAKTEEKQSNAEEPVVQEQDVQEESGSESNQGQEEERVRPVQEEDEGQGEEA